MKGLFVLMGSGGLMLLCICWFKLKCFNEVTCNFVAKVVEDLGIVRFLKCEDDVYSVVISCRVDNLHDIILRFIKELGSSCYVSEVDVFRVDDLCWYKVVRGGVYVGFNRVKCIRGDVREIRVMVKVKELSKLSLVVRILDPSFIIQRARDLYGVDVSSIIGSLNVKTCRINFDLNRRLATLIFDCRKASECSRILRYVNLANMVGLENPICNEYFGIECIS